MGLIQAWLCSKIRSPKTRGKRGGWRKKRNERKGRRETEKSLTPGDMGRESQREMAQRGGGREPAHWRRWCEPPLGELKGHFMTTINSAWHSFIFSAGNKTKARAEVTDGVGLKQEGCVCGGGCDGGDEMEKGRQEAVEGDQQGQDSTPPDCSPFLQGF